MNSTHIQTGNATNTPYQGWLMGGFVDPAAGLLHNDKVEIKWGVQKAGEGRSEWSQDMRESISILVSGQMDVIFRDQTVSLTKPGDYVIWKDVEHKSVIPVDSVIITVRWPSPVNQ